MKRNIVIIIFIVSLISSFSIGVCLGFWNSPGIKSYRILKELGLTDQEIKEAVVETNQHAQEFWGNLKSDDMTGAIMGVNTLKALKDDDSLQVEKLAIMQIMSYYNVHVDGSEVPTDDLEIKLIENIEKLSFEFPELKKQIAETETEN